MDTHQESTQIKADAPGAPSAQNDRLATLGALASNISHDLNNLIMTIQGSAEMGLREIQNTAKLTKGLETILVATRHSKELIEQILTFNRQETLPKAPVHLNKVFEESKQLVEVKTPSSIRIDFNLLEEAVYVFSNESQIHQVLMNLYTNALQAMRDVGGTLTITLSITHSDNGDEQACITVADTGYGMHPDIQEKIFDPFFTTKSLGVGTGLGLAVTKTIVDQNRGSIRVSSELKKGSVFEICLPTTHERPAKQATPDTVEFQLPPSHEKKAILLVDDEPSMRGLGMDMLHSLGYRVTVAADGKEALSLVEKSPTYFDIILSDSKMPEMSGPELAEKLYTLNPGLPFVLVTAFTDDTTEERLKTIGVSDIIKKPFLISNLEKALTAALKNRTKF